MENIDMHVAGSFADVKSRFLVLWSVGAGLLWLALAPLLPKQWGVVPMYYVFEAVLALWVIRQCTHAGTSVRQLLGDFPQIRWDWRLVCLPLAVSLFVNGADWLFLYLLSHASPGLVQAIFIEDQKYKILGPTVAIAPFVVLIAPVVEELVFRGVLLRRWTIKWGARRALLASALAFGVLHGGHMMGLTAAGILLGVLAIRTGALWVPIACHVTNNFLAFFLPHSDDIQSVAQLQQEWHIGLAYLVAGLVLLFALRREFLPVKMHVHPATA